MNQAVEEGISAEKNGLGCTSVGRVPPCGLQTPSLPFSTSTSLRSPEVLFQYC